MRKLPFDRCGKICQTKPSEKVRPLAPLGLCHYKVDVIGHAGAQLAPADSHPRRATQDSRDH